MDEKSPHELDVKPWPVPELATHLGTLIHQGLDAFLRGKFFDGVKAWQTLAPLRYRDRRYSDEALEQLAFAVTDPQWQGLLTTANKVETELAIVSRPQQGSNLVIGTLDALIHLGDGRLLLIDHKTTRFSQDPSTVSDAQLRAFAWSRRWQEQLADYAAALRGIYPAREIVRAIYYASLRRLVVCDGRSVLS
jgi:ATP-dependent exoDNAse (exonuclease V) beta subunit